MLIFVTADGHQVHRLTDIPPVLPRVGDHVQLAVGNYVVAGVTWDIPNDSIREVRVVLQRPPMDGHAFTSRR